MPKTNVFRGLTALSVLLLSSSTVMGMIMEKYPQGMDQTWGTQSSKTVIKKNEGSENNWSYVSKFKNAKEAIAGYKDLAMREAAESFVLLKNKDNALPLANNPKVSLFGLRSYAPVYGNSGGSIADKNTVDNGNTITECFQEEGLQLNPGRLNTFKTYFADKTWGGRGFGATPPEYGEATLTDDAAELSPAELAGIDANYAKDDASYADAAIVIVGRPGGESKNFRPGAKGLKEGVSTTTGNIMGLSAKEKEVIAEAKAKFSKVVVLINSTQVMEIKELEEDDQIDAVMWIGYPGAYGFRTVAQVLQGKINPSGRLGEVYVTNGLTAPALQNFGDDTPWDDETKAAGVNLNSYLINAEGIYTGYRYYETRYADVVAGKTSAKTAKAGTYTTGNGELATTAGEWNYDQEVVYPFGYGLSYTNFEEKLDSVSISGDHRTAEVKVTVTNKGEVDGKHAVELYAQTPYTEYDIANKVEKSAIQLVDFEKTDVIKAGASEIITMHVDLNNIASYDYHKAKTFIADDGTYYFALGRDAHEALNNVFAKQGNGTLGGNASKVYEWKWSGHSNKVDDKTFSVADNGINITNRLSEGDSAMDWNAFQKDTVTYLTRNDWNGTFPKTYTGLKPSERMKKLLTCDWVDLVKGDTSAYKWGVDNGLTIKDFKNADWDDPRWSQLVDQVTPAEFLDFASHAFHNLQGIPSVGLEKYAADDGPGGSDTNYFNKGQFQGQAWDDIEAARVKGSPDDKKQYMGTRVTPAQTNIAYTWNKELAYENGVIILGETSVDLSLPIMIGPAMNLKRHGYNGRGGEYLSEDPILSGFIGSAIVQGAQSMGCIVNIKHAAFNDQEINRSGVATFQNEQAARELELRNLNKAFTAKGKPAKWMNDESKKDTYTEGALGVMSSYNRIGALPSSGNKAVMQDIMRDEWGFKGYNVTDFTGVSLKAAPKESILYGTTAFCGFGSPKGIEYWDKDKIIESPMMCEALKKDIKYILYSVCHSNILNNTDVTIETVQQTTSWRIMYKSMIGISAGLVAVFGGLTLFTVLKKKKEDK